MLGLVQRQRTTIRRIHTSHHYRSAAEAVIR
jgi:hypothetical protein